MFFYQIDCIVKMTHLSHSWVRWYKEYITVHNTFEDLINLQKRMSDPYVIDALSVWSKSKKDYHKKSEGLEQAERELYFSLKKAIRLLEGQDSPDSECLKKKMPNELPDDVLSIIRAYSRPVFRWYKEYNEAKSLFASNFSSDEFIKLRKKMDDPTVREQVKMSIDAYKQGEEAYERHSDPDSEETWWFTVSIQKLAALINDQEYRMLNYAEWVFKDDINDAWMDSEDDSWDERDDELLSLQEEWMAEYELAEYE